MKIFKEFKTFITRGNVLDMAVGLIIGTAFTAIVKSLTNAILMPLIGAFTGGADFKSLRIILWNAELVEGEVDAYGQQLYTSAIYYGEFIQAILDFLLIALVLFMIIKTFNKMREKAEKAKEKLAKEEKAAEEVAIVEEAPKAPTTEELLTKIIELLEEKNKENTN